MTDYNRTTWVNGVTPANATNMNNIEAYLDRISNTPGVVATGSVSGTATVYMPFQGIWKIAVVVWNNYKSATAQSMALPTAFSFGSLWWCLELQSGQLEGLVGGVAQTFSVQATLGQGSAGTQNPFTALKAWSQGQLRAGCDTVRITSTASAASGLALIAGM